MTRSICNGIGLGVMSVAMEVPKFTYNPIPSQKMAIKLSNTSFPIKTHVLPRIYNLSSSPKTLIPHEKANNLQISTKPNQKLKNLHGRRSNLEDSVPTMSEIMDASRLQNLDIRLQTFGPFFRIEARNLESGRDLGRAEGVIRVWFGGKILHLDSIKLKRATIGMEKSIFGIGLFIGAVAIRHGYDCGCKKAELLAINDTELYHAKLVKFYKRLGFKEVCEVEGSKLGDLSHMLVWGGVGTRMDANLQDLMIKWCSRFKTSSSSNGVN